jgi:anti-sigma factor RsiW
MHNDTLVMMQPNTQETQMKTVHSDPYADHQAVLLTLPWYVNKTLQGAELSQVEAHLNVCLTCKREVLSLQNLALRVKQPAAFDTVEQVAFAQFKKRLHPTQPVNQIPALQVVNSTARQPSRTQRPSVKSWSLPRPALALAAVLMLSLLIPGYFKLNQLLSTDYRTLSDGGQTTLSHNEIHLVFSDTTTAKQIINLLAPFSGEIITQPTTQAVYTVRFAKAHTAADLLQILAALRKNSQVVFAEPAFAVLSPL